MQLIDRFPPSPPCRCPVCQTFCARPGWWTVSQCKRAFDDGLLSHTMLEIAPDFSLAVISPAFKGNEGFIAAEEFSHNGCTFLINGRCELHGKDYYPLECRFCHHDRPGQGKCCHAALEHHWNSHDGRRLVNYWLKETGLAERIRLVR